MIEANIDDMTPQNFAYVTEKLLAAGALDVFTIPIQMKKAGPAICCRCSPLRMPWTGCRESSFGKPRRSVSGAIP